MSRLRLYVDLLQRWNARINLIGPGTKDAIWERHVEDGAVLAGLIPSSAVRVCDLGSGAGIPGFVVALVRPALDVWLLEVDKRKAAFLREAARMAGVRVRVVNERIETAAPVEADVVMARALAPLPRLLALCDLHRRSDPQGRVLLIKGRRWQREVTEARASWDFAVRTYPLGNDGGAILEIDRIRRAAP